MPEATALYPLSLDDLSSAWLRVDANGGCAGADAVTRQRFSAHLQPHLQSLFVELQNDTYRPIPLLKILIEKPNQPGKSRRLLVPAVRDRVVQTAVARKLHPEIEEESLDVSFAYRPGYSVDSAIARVLQWRDRGYQFVLEADIRDFFDSVDHSLLLNLLAADHRDSGFFPLLSSWIHAELWDGHRVSRLRRGIPQGSPLSPLFANLFLNGFDRHLSGHPWRLVRYADDFVVLCPGPQELQQALEATRAWLASHRLELKSEKVRAVTFQQGFTFLGVHFQGADVWRPWKQSPPRHRVVFAARPMPARLLQQWRSSPAPATALARALRPLEPDLRAAVHPVDSGGPPMAYLYVTEQGALVRKSGTRFLVEAGNQVLADLPASHLESLALFGGVQITSQALAELLQLGASVSFFSRRGILRGRAAAPAGKDVSLRLQQYHLCSSTQSALPPARLLVQAKIANAAAVLDALHTQSGPLPDFELVSSRLAAALPSAAAAADPGQLNGVEGAAARIYLDCAMSRLPPPFVWNGRNRHPPLDPANALLSLAYTLIAQELAGVLEAAGLDPYLGFYHQPDFGRQSLAQDLLEPFRHPVADRLVLSLFRQNYFQPADFVQGPEGQGIYLSLPSLKRFFSAYEQWMLATPGGRLSFRRCLHREAEEFKRFLRGGEWTPFSWKAGAVLETSPDTGALELGPGQTPAPTPGA